MKVAIGCDHGGLVLKESIINVLKKLNIEFIDYGTNTPDSVDYPKYASLVAQAVLDGAVDKGIIMCGTGIGISIAANKHKGIRCAHVTDLFSAEMCAAHNNANMIALGGRITNEDMAAQIVEKYLTTKFEGGRHQKRLDLISDIEKENYK